MKIQPDGLLQLPRPVSLPEVLDLLIVGGGPAGTASAFRAKELGLSALVIDYDDIMKRIRDYAQGKPILPDFGGGDQMAFPAGDTLVSSLQFTPMDKDAMYAAWKALYFEHAVPAQVGVELMGLASQGEELRVKTWNHNTKSESFYVARHVVLAFGRGVPRRFDIAGNVAGISYRMSDPIHYLGQPACIIGGGMSAAEAVIAISNVKKAHGDTTRVYWSYRGDNMPKVSKSLADAFFEAYIGNGNIRYLPKSEPVAVNTVDGQGDYLCLRTDEKIMAGRPREITHLEFLKTHCIACIGEDIPEKLLNSMGIYLVSGGPKNRKRLVVSPLMESCVARVYLIGDILSPAYLQTEDFDDDPSTYQEIGRRGNIKAALRDGVFVSEVVAQRRAGKTRIAVKLRFAATEPRPVHEPASATAGKAPTTATARLVRVLQDQVLADEYRVSPTGVTWIGNRNCDICFEDDLSLSERHARIRVASNRYLLEVGDGADDLFLEPAKGKWVEVCPGTILRAGHQWLVLRVQDSDRHLIHYDKDGHEKRRLPIPDRSIVLGRESSDVILDPSDSTLSRRHLAVAQRDGRVLVRDLESTNGTFLKVDEPTEIHHGDKIRLGHQVLQFVWEAENTPSREVDFEHRCLGSGVDTHKQPSATRGTPGATRTAASGEEPVVTFQTEGKTVTARKGQTICELAEECGIAIKAQCHRGICGSDPLRVVSGEDHLNPISEGEEETLDEVCVADGATYRLACMARPTGPVVVELVKSM